MSLLKEFRIYHKGEGLFTPRLFYCGWCYKDMVESIPCLCCTLLMLIRMCDFSWIKHISFQSFFLGGGGCGEGGCRGHQFHNLNCNIECRIMSPNNPSFKMTFLWLEFITLTLIPFAESWVVPLHFKTNWWWERHSNFFTTFDIITLVLIPFVKP